MERAAHDPLALVRVPVKTAAEVCVHARLGPEALLLLRKDQTPRQFLELLLRTEKFSEAIRFLAFGLPRREAIWWGCLGVLHERGDRLLPPGEARALQAAVRWVIEPNEPHREAAEQLAGTQTPANYMAKAVAWTGGSLSPPGLPVVPPPVELPHRGVNAALAQAIINGPIETIDTRFRHTLALGIHIARGHSPWSK
jgi:hypothetical protein